MIISTLLTSRRPSTRADDPTDAAVGEADHPCAEQTDGDQRPGRRKPAFTRVLAFVVLPLAAVLLAALCGYLKWQVQAARDTTTARIESVQVAKDSTVALLSYSPDTVDRQLAAARDLLTGPFRDSYTSLTNDVVIPAAKQKHVSAAATVPAVASISATPDHALAMVFVDQTTIIGSGAPTVTSSVVRISLDRVDGRWLVSSFDPM
jgi:Mce-associated membrane protein